MVDLRGRGPGRGAPREQAAGGGSVPPRRLHGDGGGTRLGRAASVGRCGGGLELGGGWNGAEGRARARRTNGGRRAWARGELGSGRTRAGACLGFYGRAGWRRRGWARAGRSGGLGSAGSGRGARPDAAVAERGVRGGAGSQRGQHARSSGGDGVAQRGSGAVAAVTRWRGQAARQQCSGSGAARAGVRARVAQREQRSQGELGREREEREREKSQRVDFKVSQNF